MNQSPWTMLRRRSRRAAALILAPVLALTTAVGVLAPTTDAQAAATAPDVKKLAGELADQELTWQTCDFGDPALNERFNVPNVSCATVTVPQDWHDPANGKTWNIRISQAKNIDVDNGRYQGTVFANPGGPGGEGLVWGPAMQERTPDMNPYYNYIGFDPRGVGQSSHASCEYSYDPDSTDPNAEVKAAGGACSTNAEVKTINTEQTTYDMDFIRFLLGAPKLSYIGYSYGTWLGAWYEKVFGAKYGDKFVLDSSIDSTQPTLQGTWDLQPIARDRQFELHMMNWIARHDAEYKLGEDPQKIYSDYFAATAKLDPSLVLFAWIFLGGAGAFGFNGDYPLAGEVVKFLIDSAAEEGAVARSSTAQANPAAATDALLARGEKKASPKLTRQIKKARQRLAPLVELKTKKQRSQAEQKSAGKAAATETGVLEDPFEMIRCNDGQWTQGENYWDKHNKTTAEQAPLSDSWGLLDVPVCAYWRANNLMPVAQKSFPKTIVVQGEMDSQTGWEGGYAAGTQLPNTSLIAIDNEGTHGHFPYGTEAVDRPIYNYFLDGKQPKNIKVTQGLPLPEDQQTYESWAKLNKKAKHTGKDATSPWIPVDSKATKIKSSSAGDNLLARSTTDPLLRQRVQQVYGADGVRALHEQGVL